MATLFIILLWVAIDQSGGTVDLKTIIPYYFIASGVAEITMSYFGLFGRSLGGLIKYGTISNILIKPINPLLFIYAQSLGENGTRIILGFAMVFIGFALDSKLTVEKFIIFILFLILGIIVSFAFNVYEGIIYFFIPEAGGFRSTINHIKNILGGWMVPLYVFPNGARQIIELLPFATGVYYPSHSLNMDMNQAGVFFISGIFWCVILNFLAYKMWNRSLRRYDAVGM